jgi:hypothetical protein
MEGTYYGTNKKYPCLVCWDKNLGSGSVLIDTYPREKAAHAYWVPWHSVEIVPPSP